MHCPNCRSTNIEVTTMGVLLRAEEPQNDPNRATCVDCGRSGNAGDWHLIEQLRQYVGRMLGSELLAHQP